MYPGICLESIIRCNQREEANETVNQLKNKNFWSIFTSKVASSNLIYFHHKLTPEISQYFTPFNGDLGTHSTFKWLAEFLKPNW